MSIDYDNVQKLISFVNSCIGMESDLVLTDEKLDSYIKLALSMFPREFTEAELKEVRNDLTYQHQIHCDQGVSLLSEYDDEKWYTEKKAAGKIDEKFWSRYKTYLIEQKHFSPNIVTTLGNETLERDLMNYLGNPDASYDFLKRGLIIGDVQSGKTSTYIGMMCKAADAGYKVFILLTGTIESLRRQTQERVEEGFIGLNMSAETESGKRVGVGLDNKEIYAMSMTSRKGDFVGNSDQIAVSLRSNDAVVFVIKKNSAVLQKLIEWLKTINADKLTGRIDEPMLLIDDEADNASINTSASKDDPSKINKLIRELARLFTKSNYVGFTATPYANVFIDPVTTEDMLTHDLFPEDFIYALPTPSNYIGPCDTFKENSKFYNQLIPIYDAGRTEDDGYPFYFKHRKEWEDILPESLTDSIYTFYLANAIRDIKGHQRNHRSMLINISRFVKVQYYTKSVVENIHNNAYRSVKFNLNPDDFEGSMSDPVLNRIYRNWEEQYSSIENITWEDIARTLFRSIEEIQIKVVNSTTKKDKLVYTDDMPVRVIAIGGLALSRGLTLEGLVISYFYRNTATYDVLMQMGRWFGYRKGYEELFRIWTHPDSARWYAEIAEATEILKNDMREMHDRKLKPKYFGIRVRNDCRELQITARNKMRNTRDVYEFSSYAGKLVETPYLLSDPIKNRENFENIKSFVDRSVDEGKPFELMQGSGKHYVLQNIEKYRILELLRKMHFSDCNYHFDKSQIIDYISDETASYINNWDVAFMDGTKAEPNIKNTVILKERRIFKTVRNNCSIDDGRLSIGTRGKMSGLSDGKIGLAPGKAEEAMHKFREYYLKEYGSSFSKGRSYPADTWFRFVSDRKPIILVYMIDVSLEKQNSDSIQKYKAQMTNPDGSEIPSVGIAIGFPAAPDAKTSSGKRYKANHVYNYFEASSSESETEEVE